MIKAIAISSIGQSESLSVTTKSHLTYMNLTDPLFKQTRFIGFAKGILGCSWGPPKPLLFMQRTRVISVYFIRSR